MNVYCASDDNKEHLLIAANIQALISHLIKINVLNNETDIIVINNDTNDCEWTTLKEFYGDCWQNTIANLNINELYELFLPTGIIFSKKKVID